MVIAYWEIGEQIYKACGENDRSEYGKNLLKYLSDKLTAEFGKGFTERNLRAMRQFYSCFLNRHTLCAELSWSHYRILMKIADRPPVTSIQTNVQNQRGASGSLNARSTRCTISDCLQARISPRWQRRFRPAHRSPNMKKRSKTPISWSFCR